MISLDSNRNANVRMEIHTAARLNCTPAGHDVAHLRPGQDLREQTHNRPVSVP
jgi:hypothetical protein